MNDLQKISTILAYAAKDIAIARNGSKVRIALARDRLNNACAIVQEALTFGHLTLGEASNFDKLVRALDFIIDAEAKKTWT